MPLERIPLKDLNLDQYDFVNPQQSQPNQQKAVESSQKSEESLASNLIGGAKNLIASAASAPFALAELPGNLVNLATGHTPKEKSPSQRIYETLGGTEPTNVISKALNYTAGNWPLLLLGGPVTGGKVAADFASSLGMSAAEEAGFGTLGQLAGAVAGAKGFNAASNALKSAAKQAPKNPTKYNEFISSFYTKTEDLGSKIHQSGDRLERGLNKINEKLRSEYVNPGKFDEAARNRVLKNLETAEKSISKPNLTAADIFNEKKNLNKAYGWKDSTEGKYYAEIRKLFADELDDIAKQHPDFGKAYKTADELWQLRNGQTWLGQWVEKRAQEGTLNSILNNKIALGAIGLLTGGSISGLVKGVGLGSVQGGINMGAKALDYGIREARFLNKVAQSEGGKKLLLEIMADSAKGNSLQLASHLKKLNQLANEYQKNEPKESQEPKSLERIPLSKLDLNQYDFVI